MDWAEDFFQNDWRFHCSIQIDRPCFVSEPSSCWLSIHSLIRTSITIPPPKAMNTLLELATKNIRHNFFWHSWPQILSKTCFQVWKQVGDRYWNYHPFQIGASGVHAKSSRGSMSSPRLLFRRTFPCRLRCWLRFLTASGRGCSLKKMCFCEIMEEFIIQ